MKNLIQIGFKHNLKKVVIASVLICSMVFMSMQFFPAVAENAALLNEFFSVGIMNQLLLAFGINVAALTSILGFYATYTSMFVVLIGSVFFASFAYDLLAKEEREGTIEYLASRPLTRGQIFAGKYLVLISFIAVFGLILSSSGYLALEVAENYGQVHVVMANYDQRVEKAILAESETISSWLPHDEKEFEQLMMTVMMSEYQTAQDDMGELDFNMTYLEDHMEEILMDPEGYLQRVLADPAYYLELLQLPDMDVAAFTSEVEKRITEYQVAKEEFLTTDNIVETYFLLSPQYFLQSILDLDRAEAFDALMVAQGVQAKIYQVYELSKFITLQFNMLLAILVMASIGYCFAALTNGRRSSGQIIMLLVIATYFLNTFTQLAPSTKFISYFTPFAYFDLAVNSPDFGLHPARLALIASIMVGLVGLSFWRYQRKEF